MFSFRLIHLINFIPFACLNAASSLTCEERISKSNFRREDRARYQYLIRQTGLTVRLCVSEGRVTLYASVDIPNPNRALNSFILNPNIAHGIPCEDVFVTLDNVMVLTRHQSEQTKRKRQVSPLEDNEVILYVTIEGVDNSSSFTLDAPSGNSTQCELLAMYCLCILWTELSCII